MTKTIIIWWGGEWGERSGDGGEVGERSDGLSASSISAMLSQLSICYLNIYFRTVMLSRCHRNSISKFSGVELMNVSHVSARDALLRSVRSSRACFLCSLTVVSVVKRLHVQTVLHADLSASTSTATGV